MDPQPSGGPLRLFTTCPQSRGDLYPDYVASVVEAARWSEDVGCEGMLVYTDNGIVDPWLVSQVILQNTRRICPLIAVQPIYMHPYTVAKMIASFGYLHRRRIYLNMLAGGFKNDLLALGDTTPHDDRYLRTTEYTQIVRALLEGRGPVTFEGKYYTLRNCRMTPPLDPALFPGILISGSSPAGVEAARAIGGVAIKYPKPPGEEQETPRQAGVECGFRVGIVARDSDGDAWRVARERFPEDRKGQITQQLAMKVSDSHWHKQLAARDPAVPEDSPYWLGPFHNYSTFCPYLVGSHERVAKELAGYLQAGFRTLVLDIPPAEEDLRHTVRAFDLARRGAGI